MDHRPKFPRRSQAARDPIDPELEEASKLGSLIKVAGDKPNLAVSLISDIATVIVRDFNRFRESVSTTFAGCAAEYSHKPHVYAALLTAVAKQEKSVADTMLEYVHHQLTAALQADRVAHVRSIARFLSILADLGTLSTTSLIDSVLHPLASTLSTGVLDNRRDVYATVLVTSTMFAPTALAPYRSALLGPVLEYVKVRSSDHQRVALLNTLRPLDPDVAPFPQNDALLEYVFQATQLFPLDGLVPASPIPLAHWVTLFSYTNASNDIDADDTTDMHHLPPLTLNPVDLGAHSDNSMMHFDAPALVSFRIFNDDLEFIPGFPATHTITVTPFKPSVPPAGSIERLVCTDIVTDLLLNIQFNHKAGVRSLLDLKLLFAQKTFELDADEALVVAETQGMHPAEPQYNYEQLVIELVLTALFRLPAPQVRPIFYTNIIMGLCRISPKRIAQSLAKAVHILFGRMEGMDYECMVRLVDLFSHHLSNFGYGWKWADWAFVLYDSDESKEQRTETDAAFTKRRVFMHAVLERITRLAYYDRIKSVLPEMYAATYAAMEPHATPQYARPDLQELAESVHLLIAERQDPDSIMLVGTEMVAKLIEAGVEDVEAAGLVRHAMVTAILTYGDTMSHKLSVLDKHMTGVVQALAPKEQPDARVDLVRIAFNTYGRNRQFFAIVLDKLLAARACLPTHALTWLAAELAAAPQSDDVASMQVDGHVQVEKDPFMDRLGPVFVLEILVLLVKKTLHRVDALEAKLQDAEFVANASAELQAVVSTNIEKAHQEKNQVLLQITDLLLVQAAIERSSNADPSQLTHWSSWSVGSLLTLLRMYMADMDTGLRQRLLQYIQDQSPNERSKASLTAVFALE